MIWKIGAVLLVSLAASEGSPVEGPLCACPFVNHPVCGSDGITYDNDCMLRCLNPSATVEYRGACGHKEVPCFCTADYAPVCGTNDRTYSNECSLNCDKGGIHSIPNLALKHTGVCRDKRNTESKQCACPFIIQPVCGSDGLTYDNDCMLRCMNPGATIEYRGSCGHKEVPCICTEEYAPVCGTNDRTYPNECSLNCDKHGPHSFPNLALKHHGVCKTKRSVDLTDCICPLRILHELCGTDGETYANDCYFDCAKGKQTGLKVQHEGRCNAKRSSDPKECACPAISFPVCGTDGLTYPNDCMLKCSNPEAEVRHHGECNKNEGKTKRSVDVADLCQCTLDLDPVCGTDGKTYGNKCALNCTKHRNNKTALAVKHEGECKSKPDPCTCTFELDEQCGSDGNTYPNPCVLECQRKKRPELELRHSGVCKEVSKRSVETVKVAVPSCLCVQRNKHEVCGTDGVSYVNDCFFDCAKRRQPALEVSHEGRCVEKVSVVEIAQGLRDPCFCVQKILHEICGTDGVTYANDCFFECAKSKQSTLEIAHEGRCEKVAVVEG